MGTKKTTILVVVIIVILTSIFYLDSIKNTSSNEKTSEVKVLDIGEKTSKFEKAKEIDPTYGFINSEPFALADLIGKKVILLDIWTYSCINCQRTLPYINGWYDKYKDQGLEIIGVHTPEFAFEKEYENVKRAVEQFGINYPVVLDNDYKTWNAYNNRYWPRKYLIDIDGFVVYDHIGEGGYAETEKMIQELLVERKERLGESIDVSTDTLNPSNAESITDGRPRSPEIYFGAWRNEYFEGGIQGTEGVQNLPRPTDIKTSKLYLVGSWNIGREYAENKNAGDSIIFKYQGQKMFMVASSEKPIRAKILLDGKLVGASKGSDVDENGYVTIKEDQLYRIIEDSKGWGEHIVEIIPEGAGLMVFSFTFG